MSQSQRRILERLKVVPLTLLLTLLLWMYADAHLTAIQNNLPFEISVVVPPSNTHDIVQIISPMNGTFHVDIQGPRNQVQQISDQAEGRAIFTRDDLNNLAYVVQHLANLKIGAKNYISAVRVFNDLPYFRQRHVTVTTVRPALIQLAVDQMVSVSRPIVFTALRQVAARIVPAVAQVKLPKSLLTSIGGQDQIRVEAQPLSDLTTLPPRTRQTMQTQLVVRYPGAVSSQVSVTPSTALVTFTVPSEPSHKLRLGIVPVWVRGPSWLLDRYSISIRPETVSATVTGSQPALLRLGKKMLIGNLAPVRDRVVAFLNITSAITSSNNWVSHHIRYTMPTGISLMKGPRTVLCKIVYRPPIVPTTTQPASAPGSP
ncbi:MAG: hypothetical protein ACP5I8_02750 [Phycisphaerae bacterium]